MTAGQHPPRVPSTGPDEVAAPDEILAALRAAGAVDANLTRCEPLAGGTASRVFGLAREDGAPKLVVKVNAPAVVRAEALFLRTYAESPLLPRLRHTDEDGRFLVFDYVSGVKVPYRDGAADVREALLALAQGLIAHYAAYTAPATTVSVTAVRLATLLERDAPNARNGDGGGERRELEAETAWPQFLGDHVAYRHAALSPYVGAEDRALVERLARAERRAEGAPPSLIHGDCGAHNFLFAPGSADGWRVGKLRAVIDPDPLVGYPIYDVAFAFVSWPNGLDPDAIVPAAEALRVAGRWRPNGEPLRVLWEEVLIALYMRMGTCLVHHPGDLPAYVAAWSRWRALVR